MDDPSGSAFGYRWFLLLGGALIVVGIVMWVTSPIHWWAALAALVAGMLMIPLGFRNRSRGDPPY